MHTSPSPQAASSIRHCIKKLPAWNAHKRHITQQGRSLLQAEATNRATQHPENARHTLGVVLTELDLLFWLRKAARHAQRWPQPQGAKSFGILRQVPSLPCPTAKLLLSFLGTVCLPRDCLNLSSKRYTCPAPTIHKPFAYKTTETAPTADPHNTHRGTPRLQHVLRPWLTTHCHGAATGHHSL